MANPSNTQCASESSQRRDAPGPAPTTWGWRGASSKPTAANPTPCSKTVKSKKQRHLNDANNKLVEQAIERLGLSARSYHRILKVARTIADLAASDDINTTHLTETIFYRRQDRRQT